MILLVFTLFLIPFLFFASKTSTPVKRKPKYNHSEVYSVVLLDKNGKRIKGYTYVR